MIEQVTSVVLLLQHYFLSMCHFISLHLKRLASRINEGENDRKKLIGVGGDDNVTVSCNSVNNSGRRKAGGADSDKTQQHTKQLKPCSDIPGRRSLAVIGTLLDFNKYGPSRGHELSVDRHNEYGDIFRERLFTQELIFVKSKELLKEWMMQEGKLPVSMKQEPSVIFAEVFPELKRGLFFRNGEEWALLRRLGHSIALKNAADFEAEGLYESCEVFLEDFMQEIQDNSCDGGETGLMTDLEDRAYQVVVGCNMRLVYGAFSPAAFHKITGTDLNTLCRYSKEINVCNQNLLEVPVRLAKWFGSATWNEYSTKLEHNLSSCINYGRERRKEILASPEAASLRTHGLLYKSVNMNHNSTEDFDHLLCDFAIDSKDPFSATFMFVVQVLGACPDIQELIFEEVSQVYQPNERITYRKTIYLDYTKAFFKEILRLYPVATFTTRIASEKTVLGPYCVPPGALILFSTYAAQRDPRYFSDPLKILPERWLGEEAKLRHSNGDSNKVPTCENAVFAAFGLNQRLCLGQNMAISIALLFIANLVRKFKLVSHGMPEALMRTVLYPSAPDKPIHLTAR